MEKNTHHYCFNSFFGERMKKKLVIIGAGGYGQTVADIAHQENEYEEILFLDDNRELLDRNISVGICSNYVNYKDAWVYPAFGEYSCAGVPLFRRNGYRQSGGRKPLFRNRDTALT